MDNAHNSALLVLDDAVKLNFLADSTKKELTALAAQIVTYTADEGGDMLHALALSSKLCHFAGEIEKNARKAGLPQIGTYGREAVGKCGVKLQMKEGSVKYDYSSDPIWIKLNEVVEEASAARKAHEELLKKLPYSGMGLTDPDTGETYHAYPPAKTATETIQVTIL